MESSSYYTFTHTVTLQIFHKGQYHHLNYLQPCLYQYQCFGKTSPFKNMSKDFRFILFLPFLLIWLELIGVGTARRQTDYSRAGREWKKCREPKGFPPPHQDRLKHPRGKKKRAQSSQTESGRTSQGSTRRTRGWERREADVAGAGCELVGGSEEQPAGRPTLLRREGGREGGRCSTGESQRPGRG